MSAFRPGAKGRLRPVRPLGTEVESLARDLGLESGLKLFRLQAQWRGLFHKGPLSFHTWPAHFNEGRLTIHADSPPWLQQASFLKQEILSKLRPLGVSDIIFRIGRPAQRFTGSDVTESGPEVALSPQESDAIEEVVASLKDHDLREHIRRAMRAWARRRLRRRATP